MRMSLAADEAWPSSGFKAADFSGFKAADSSPATLTKERLFLTGFGQ